MEQVLPPAVQAGNWDMGLEAEQLLPPVAQVTTVAQPAVIPTVGLFVQLLGGVS